MRLFAAVLLVCCVGCARENDVPLTPRDQVLENARKGGWTVKNIESPFENGYWFTLKHDDWPSRTFMLRVSRFGDSFMVKEPDGHNKELFLRKDGEFQVSPWARDVTIDDRTQLERKVAMLLKGVTY